MKKIFGIVITLVLLVTFTVPVLANVAPIESTDADTPGFTTGERPEPELLPQEILDAFEDGMSIEDFLIQNTGPIPNALLEYADMTVTVIVQLDKPSLIEYIRQEGLGRGDRTDDQVAYVAELESDQEDVLSEITAGRADDVQQIGESFTKVLNGFMLNVPASMVNEIRAISGVKAITKAPEYELNLEYSIPLILAELVHDALGYTGEGVTIAIIDSGIDYTHAMLGGSGDPADYASNDPDIVEPESFPTFKVIGGYDFAGTAYTGDEVPVPDEDPLDERGHGTHVASTAAGFDIGFGSGVAPDASLYALKVFGAEGGTRLTLHAIEWAMDPNGLGHLGEPVDVINMSLGADWGPADENDPQFQAVENATSIGVVVVASAGNAGDSSYIVGSPSTADSAISVAASSTGYYYSPVINYDTTMYMPYTTSDNAFTDMITAELVDVTVVDPTALLCEIPGDYVGELTGKIALISRGTCTFTDKINNADAMGAVAAVVYNNTSGTFGMITDDSTLPAGSIEQSDGIVLQGYSGTTVSIGPDDAVMTFVSDDPADTIADFSSRGPRGFDSKLKPEITAPGVAIFAAEMGSGLGGVSYSGTSMAAPHIAGVAALMLEAHPGWDPIHIKAAMMNNAVDLVGAASGVVPLQGAGRVNAYDSVNLPFSIYADPKLVSLSWGVIEITDDFSDTQTITVRSFYDGDLTFTDINVEFTSLSNGATLTPAVTEVTVPAYGVAGLDVTLTLTAADLPQGFGYQEEYYGYVNFTIGDYTLRVPFYFVPHIYTEITEIDAYTEFEVNTEFAEIEMEQTGPRYSSLWSYPVSLVSDNDPTVLDAGDLRYVGMDYGWFDPSFGDYFVPAFAMWGGVHTNQPYFSEVDLYIDTPYGSVVDFNYNLGWWDGVDDNNIWVVIQYDFVTGYLYLGSPYTIYADYNSGYQEWYLPAYYHYILDEFTYEVVSFDWNGNYDYAGMATFNLSRPPMSLGFTNWEPWETTFYAGAWVEDFASYIKHDIQGFMIVDYYGQAGVGQSYYWDLSPFENTLFPMMLK